MSPSSPHPPSQTNPSNPSANPLPSTSTSSPPPPLSSQQRPYKSQSARNRPAPQRSYHPESTRGRTLSYEDLSKHFHLPINTAATHLGVCVTALKKQCRKHGISRWPHRKLKSLDKLKEKLEKEGANAADKEYYKHEIHSIVQKKEHIFRSNSKPTSAPPTSSPNTAASQTPSSSTLAKPPSAVTVPPPRMSSVIHGHHVAHPHVDPSHAAPMLINAVPMARGYPAGAYGMGAGVPMGACGMLGCDCAYNNGVSTQNYHPPIARMGAAPIGGYYSPGYGYVPGGVGYVGGAPRPYEAYPAPESAPPHGAGTSTPSSGGYWGEFAGSNGVGSNMVTMYNQTTHYHHHHGVDMNGHANTPAGGAGTTSSATNNSDIGESKRHAMMGNGHGPSANGTGTATAANGSGSHGRMVMGTGCAVVSNGSAMVGNGSAVVGMGRAVVGNGSAIVGNGSAVVGNGSAVVGSGRAVVGNGRAVVGNGNAVVGMGHAAMTNGKRSRPGGVVMEREQASERKERAGSSDRGEAAKKWIGESEEAMKTQKKGGVRKGRSSENGATENGRVGQKRARNGTMLGPWPKSYLGAGNTGVPVVLHGARERAVGTREITPPSDREETPEEGCGDGIGSGDGTGSGTGSGSGEDGGVAMVDPPSPRGGGGKRRKQDSDAVRWGRRYEGMVRACGDVGLGVWRVDKNLRVDVSVGVQDALRRGGVIGMNELVENGKRERYQRVMEMGSGASMEWSESDDGGNNNGNMNMRRRWLIKLQREDGGDGVVGVCLALSSQC